MKSFWEEKGKIDGELARRVSLSVFFTFAVSGQMHRHVGDTTFSQKRQLIALRPLSSSAGRALGVRNPATPTQALLSSAACLGGVHHAVECRGLKWIGVRTHHDVRFPHLRIAAAAISLIGKISGMSVSPFHEMEMQSRIPT